MIRHGLASRRVNKCREEFNQNNHGGERLAGASRMLMTKWRANNYIDHITDCVATQVPKIVAREVPIDDAVIICPGS